MCTDGVISLERGGPAAEAVHPDFAVKVDARLLGSATRRVLVSLDGPLLEVFADDGATVLSSLVMIGAGPVRLTLTGTGTVALVEL